MRVLYLLAAIGATMAPAAAQDEAAGRVLVSTYCAGCHAIERVGASPHPDAPPLRTLNERYDVELLSEALVEGLVSGHPDMPEFAFDPQEAAAIVDYLGWLAK
jgi:cytochrome c